MNKTLFSLVVVLLLFLPVSLSVSNSGYSKEYNDDNYEDMIKFKMKYSNIEGSNYFEDYDFDELHFVNSQIESIQSGDNIQTTNPDDGPMDSSWPMKCHDARHTSQSPHSTEDNPQTEKWRFLCKWGGHIEGSPVIDAEGNIYFGTMGSDRKLYCLYQNGTKKWSYQLEGFVWSTPALGEDGTVYLTCWDGFLHAFNPNGTKKWQYSLGGDSSSSPAIGEDGTIYFGSTSGFIFAVNPNGTLKWEYETNDWTMSSPAIGEDGTIYIGSYDSGLYAMNQNGSLKWRFDTGGYIKCSPSISEDGIIYINSWDNNLYAIYPNGTLNWKTNVGRGMSGSASIAEDGTIYFFTETLDAYYPNNGTLKWRLDVGGNGGRASPAISSDGTIYVGNHEGYSIVAVSPQGEEIWRKKISNQKVVSSPAIAEDGTIYIGSSWYSYGTYNYGYLHAFGLGELNAVAGGPYEVYAGQELQFNADVFGGIPPYEYHWDFGDGNESDLEDPIHIYNQLGTYNATFTVTDSEQNVSVDYAEVTVTSGPPIVNIL